MTETLEVLQKLMLRFPGLAEEVPDDPEAILIRIASRLIDCVQEGETVGLPDFFAEVEHQVIYGTDEVRNMIVVGLLENLKNLASVQNVDYAIFEDWLGPESHVAWRWLEKRWRGRESLADSLRSLRKSGESP